MTSPRMRLAGRIAIVTGATSGIGRAIALLFAREGARVCVNGRDAERGREVVRAIEQHGGQACFMAGDVRLAVDCQRVVDGALAAFGGRLDILVNNAGVYFPHDAVGCTEEEWDLTCPTTAIEIPIRNSYPLSARPCMWATS